MGDGGAALVLGLRILNLTIHRLETELAEQLDRHADTPRSCAACPVSGVVLAGRMLSEFGDLASRGASISESRPRSWSFRHPP